VYSAKQLLYKALILFIDKKNGKLKMCIDHRALKKKTIKNNYPLPHIVDLLDRLNGYQYYNQIDF